MEEIPNEEVRLITISIDRHWENSSKRLLVPIVEKGGYQLYYLEKFWFKIDKKYLITDSESRKQTSFDGIIDQIEAYDNGDIVVGINTFDDKYEWQVCATVVDADIVITNLERLHARYKTAVKSAEEKAAGKWISLGSEIEIDATKLISTRQPITCEWIRRISMKNRTTFTDVDYDRLHNGLIVISPTDESSIRRLRKYETLDVGIQACSSVKAASTSTFEDTITYEDIAIIMKDIIIEDATQHTYTEKISIDDTTSRVFVNDEGKKGQRVTEMQTSVSNGTLEAEYRCVKTFANVWSQKKKLVSSLSWNPTYPGIFAVAYKDAKNHHCQILPLSPNESRLLSLPVLSENTNKQGKLVSEEDVKYYNSIFKSVLHPPIGQNVVDYSSTDKKKYSNQRRIQYDTRKEMELDPVEEAAHLASNGEKDEEVTSVRVDLNFNKTKNLVIAMICLIHSNEDDMEMTVQGKHLKDCISTIESDLSQISNDDAAQFETYETDPQSMNVVEITILQNGVQYAELLAEDVSENLDRVESIREGGSDQSDDSDAASAPETSLLDDFKLPLYDFETDRTSVDYDNCDDYYHDLLPIDDMEYKVLVWNINDELKPRSKLHYFRDVNTIAFCPRDGTILAAGDYKGTLVLWYIDNLASDVNRANGVNAEDNSKHDSEFWATIKGWSVSEFISGNIFRPVSVTDFNVSHLDCVTHIEWLPAKLRIDKSGRLTSSQSDLNVNMPLQLISSSSDGVIKIWNVRINTPANVGDEDKNVVDAKPSFALILIYTVEVTNPNLNPNLVPICKFTLCPLRPNDECKSQRERVDITSYNGGGDKPCMTKVLVCTDIGEVGLIGWFGSEADEPTSTLKTEKCEHLWWNLVHDDKVSSLNRNFFYPNIILSAGGKILALWNITYKESPIWSRSFPLNIVNACFVSEHPSIIKVGLEDGNVETWDVTRNIHIPIWKLEKSKCRCNPIVVSVPPSYARDVDLLIVDGESNIQLLKIEQEDERTLRAHQIEEAGLFFKNATLAKIQTGKYGKLFEDVKVKLKNQIDTNGTERSNVVKERFTNFIRSRTDQILEQIRTRKSANIHKANAQSRSKISAKKYERNFDENFSQNMPDPNEVYDAMYGEIEDIMSCLLMVDEITDKTNKSADETTNVSDDIVRRVESLFTDDYERLEAEILQSMEKNEIYANAPSNINEIRRKYLAFRDCPTFSKNFN